MLDGAELENSRLSWKYGMDYLEWISSWLDRGGFKFHGILHYCLNLFQARNILFKVRNTDLLDAKAPEKQEYRL